MSKVVPSVRREVSEAPLTLDQAPPRPLGVASTTAFWGNLGISLLLPVAAVYVVLPNRPLGVTLLAIVVGAAIGAILLGLAAAPGAREGAPAMVLLRGLLGRRASYLPTVANLIQCLGWATFEIVVIAEAASRILDAPRWPFVVAAGILATLMALRPLGVVRLLARYAVWVALAAMIYLYVQVLRQPLPESTGDGNAMSFWTAVDVVIALPVSWAPLAADYTRHARDARTAGVGAALGYGTATIAFFTLGVLALLAYGTGGLDVIDALLAVPLGALALLVLVVIELDEAFANIYSTAVSSQNIAARLDRRILAGAVGAVATLLALSFDIVAYEPFLFLIGSVFVPLVGVLIVAYYVLPRGPWDVSEAAPARPLLLPWAVGFAAYQLTLPTFFAGPGAGWTAWWSARQADLGIDPGNGLSASLVSLAVAMVLTAIVGLPAVRRHRKRTAVR